jgi:hexosaminidase
MSFRNVIAMMCSIGFPLILANVAQTHADEPVIIPRPAVMEFSTGTFEITPSTRIIVGPDYVEVRALGKYLADILQETAGVPLQLQALASDETVADAIVLALRDKTANVEEYVLTVTDENIMLAAGRTCGLFYGIQTIRQLLRADSVDTGRWRLPCVYVLDHPRYRWRGMLLDCGRHFMDKEFVKRYIDLLAYHKMNVLHWHLTEDQGWRIEIKKYPRLTEVGAWRTATRDSEQPRDGQRYGGFYTQEDIKEIVEYARSRYITIVPEIEMPGHSVAALAAYPELSCTGGPFKVGTRWGIYEDVYCAGNDKTFEFLEDVLTEMIELFPSEFIHIGGDECPKDRWKNCPKCQARIKAEGLKDEHELQSYFIHRIEKFLNSKGRRLIGWDEILEGGLAPNATVQSWRGMDGALAAASAGHDVISSPTSHCYLDYAQVQAPGEPTQMGFLPLERVYSFEPMPAELTPEQAKHVLGLEGNMWTEHAPQKRVDWQVFPRLCALAEVAWTPKELRDFGDFSRRMRTYYRRLDSLGVTYFIPPPSCVSRETTFAESIDVALGNPFGRGEIRYTLDGSDSISTSPRYERPLRITETTTVTARIFLADGRGGAIGEFRFTRE